MGDDNPIRTLRDYSKPSHEGYMNTIELPVGNNVYCMEDPEQAFVKYASSRTDEVGGKWYTFKPEQKNLGDTYNPSWRSYPNLRWRQLQNSQNIFSNPLNRFQPNSSILNHSFNNNPQSFNNISNLEGMESIFMASQDARLSKVEADFKQQQSEMTNKINTVLKAITNRIAGALPSDTVKNSKLTDGTKSYPVGIVKDVEVRIGKLKLLNDFYMIDMKKDPETPLPVGRGFLATTNAVIYYRMAKIAVGERITRKDFLDCHFPEEWEIAKDVELNPFKDTLMFEGWLYLMRRGLEVIRKFHCMILGGRFNHLSHVSSLLLSKRGEY
nr:MAK10-like protein [Tanacetum cinerariifolium]